MTIEERLVALLVPAVVAKCYPLTAPDATTTPYTVYMVVAQEPIETQQESLVTGLRQWDIQFSSYSEAYSTARGQTQAILDFLTTFHDAGIRAVFLKARRTMWDDDTKLHHSMAELHILEALG